MPNGTWTAKTSIPSPECFAMASFRLANSKIYLAGGVVLQHINCHAGVPGICGIRRFLD